MKIRFIINPVSGTGKQKEIEKLISAHLNYPDYDIKYTQKSGDGTFLSRKAVSENVNVIVVVGGDGSVNECAKALIGTNTALAVIPCGSGNGFAYHLKTGRTIIKAIKQLNSANISLIDSCIINNLPFVNVGGIGFDAHIAKLFSKNKKRGFLSYIKLILKELSYKANQYTLVYDEKEKKVEAYLIAFANSSQYGNDAKIAPLANICDGLIDCVIVKKFPKWKIPLFLFNIFRGRTHLSQYVEIIKTTRIIIKSNEKLIHIDGEPHHIENPIQVQIQPKTLKIFSSYA